MIVVKLQDGTISKEEFEALPYLDRRLFEETAKNRFSSLDTHLGPSHPDFDFRLEVNAHLREGADSYVKKNKEYLERQDKVKVIEVGASLGAISSLYVIDGLYKTGLTDKIELTLLDICKEPLEKTKRLDFDIQGIYELVGLSIPIEILRKILQHKELSALENYIQFGVFLTIQQSHHKKM